MTSTTGAAGHPDVDELSALTEGLLARSRATEVRQHLSGCAECSETYDSLEEIRALLGTYTLSSPMPTDVAQRIDAALAAEALLAASAPPLVETNTDAPSIPAGISAENLDRNDVSEAAGASKHRLGRRPRTHVSRETSHADVSGTGSSRPAGRAPGTSGPGRKARSRSHSRRRTVTISTVFTMIFVGIGAAILQAMTSGSSEGTATPSTARHTFSSRTLPVEVSTLLKDHPAPIKTQDNTGTPTPSPSLKIGSKGTPSPSRTTPKKATPLERPKDTAARVPDCIRKGIGRSEPPIAAEQGSYQGKDSYLVVLPHITDQTKVSAYVVDATCVHKPADSAGTVLLTQSYPRN